MPDKRIKVEVTRVVPEGLWSRGVDDRYVFIIIPRELVAGHDIGVGSILPLSVDYDGDAPVVTRVHLELPVTQAFTSEEDAHYARALGLREARNGTQRVCQELDRQIAQMRQDGTWPSTLKNMPSTGRRRKKVEVCETRETTVAGVAQPDGLVGPYNPAVD